MTTRYMDPVPRSPGVRAVLAALALGGLVSSLAGCSVVVDANRAQCSADADCASKGAGLVCNSGLCAAAQCSKDSDCTAAGADLICNSGTCEAAGADDQQWSCEGAPPANATPGYKLTMHLQGAVSAKPLPNILAELCRKLDVECGSPLAMTTADSNGGVAMTIDAGFDGYVRLTDSSSKIAPSLYFLTPPESGDLDLPLVPLASPFEAGGIVAQAGGPGTTWDKARGIILLNAFDCQNQPAANITFSTGSALDPGSFIFYLVDGLPTTMVNFTDSTGYGGLVNFPAGTATITASLGPSARKVSKVSLLVRPGYISYGAVRPNSL